MNRLLPSGSWDEKVFIGAVYLLAFTAPLSLAAAQAAAFFVIIIGAWLFIRGLGRAKISLWGGAFIAALLIMVLVSSYLKDVHTAVPQLKKSWVLLCFFPLAFYSHTYSRTRILNILLIGASLASLIGIIRFLVGAVDRAAPYSGGYTTMALFEAPLIPIAIGLYLSKKGKYRYLYLVAGAVMITGLVMSQTRAGWLAAVVGLLILGSQKYWKSILAVILIATVLIAIIPGALEKVIHKLTFGGRGDVTTGRNIIWSQGLSLVPDMPFVGYGPSSFKKLMPHELILQTGDSGINSWHSTPLEILIESGYLGLVSILGIWIGSLIAAWRYYKTAGAEKWLHLSLLAAIIVLYLAGLTTNIMRDFMLSVFSIFLWVLVFTKYENVSSV